MRPCLGNRREEKSSSIRKRRWLSTEPARAVAGSHTPVSWHQHRGFFAADREKSDNDLSAALRRKQAAEEAGLGSPSRRRTQEIGRAVQEDVLGYFLLAPCLLPF